MGFIIFILSLFDELMKIVFDILYYYIIFKNIEQISGQDTYKN